MQRDRTQARSSRDELRPVQRFSCASADYCPMENLTSMLRSTDERRRTRLPVLLMLACALVSNFALASNAVTAGERTPGVSPDGVPQRLVLALDGIPYDVFVELQQQGHFAGFHPVVRMVSTFPSLSDVSFAAIGGGKIPDGYQNMRFDVEQNKVVGNTLGSLSSRLHPNLDADSAPHSSLHRMFGYMAAYHMSLQDMHDVGRDVLASPKLTYVAYLEETDAVLHVEGRAGAERFLLKLEVFLEDLQAKVRERTGRELMVDIVSDHGSTMIKGEVVPVARLLAACGFTRRNSLKSPRDVAYTLAGIIGSVAITVAPEYSDEVARCLAPAEGVDLVAVNRGDAVGVLSADAEAELRLVDATAEIYDYRSLRGDPLQLLEQGAGERRFDQASNFVETKDAARPDSLRRLWRAFHGAVKEPSQVLISLKDGYEAGNNEVRALARIRGRAGTHGSMTRLASLGILVSNWREVEDVDSWRAYDALFSTQVQADVRQKVSEQTALITPPTDANTARAQP